MAAYSVAGRLRWTGLCCVIALAGCSGSGPELASVTGTVKLDGKPVQGARLEFHPQDGHRPTSYAMTDEDGYYSASFSDTLDGVYLGPVLVQVWTDDVTLVDGEPVQDEFPSRYNRDSELKRTVDEGSNTFDFDLTSSK